MIWIWYTKQTCAIQGNENEDAEIPRSQLLTNHGGINLCLLPRRQIDLDTHGNRIWIKSREVRINALEWSDWAVMGWWQRKCSCTIKSQWAIFETNWFQDLVLKNAGESYDLVPLSDATNLSALSCLSGKDWMAGVCICIWPTVSSTGARRLIISRDHLVCHVSPFVYIILF